LGLQCSRDDVHRVSELLGAHKVKDPVALICPFTTRPQKHWQESRWSKLAEKLASDLGFQVLMLGGSSDEKAAQRIQQNSRADIVSLVGKTTLRQSLALIKQANLVIGVDTGLTHMAVLSDVPTVALFGATRPYLHSDNQQAAVLYHPYSCSPCKRSPVCSGDYPCMAEHDVHTVFIKARDVMRI
jgi:heptosyltransferase-1